MPVAGVQPVSPELETDFEVAEEVDVAALDEDPIGLKDLREPRQAINRGCRENNAALEQRLEEIIKDLW